MEKRHCSRPSRDTSYGNLIVRLLLVGVSVTHSEVETPLPATHCCPSLRPGIRVWRIFSSLSAVVRMNSSLSELFTILQPSTTAVSLLANSPALSYPDSSSTAKAELQASRTCKNNSCWVTQPVPARQSRAREPPPSRSQRLIGPLYLYSCSASLHEPTYRDLKNHLAQPGLQKNTVYLRFT